MYKKKCPGAVRPATNTEDTTEEESGRGGGWWCSRNPPSVLNSETQDVEDQLSQAQNNN